MVYINITIYFLNTSCTHSYLIVKVLAMIPLLSQKPDINILQLVKTYC